MRTSGATLPGSSVNTSYAPWRRVMMAIVLLNALFLACLYLATWLPKEHLRARVVEAFDSGTLATRDYLRYNWKIGLHQYNDCLILQMITNPAGSALEQVLAPRVFHRPDFTEFCATTRLLVQGEASTRDLASFGYTRYWHGHNVVTAASLSVMPLGALRIALVGSVVGSLLWLAAVAVRAGGRAGRLCLFVSMFGLFFWGLPYFGPGLSHGAADAALIAGLALLVHSVRARDGLESRYLVLCGAFGAVLTFMEFLTGVLPTALALLLAISYFSARDVGLTARAAWRVSVRAAGAFGLGVVVTVLVKQLLVLLLLGPAAVAEFLEMLSYYAQSPEDERLPPRLGFLAVLAALAVKGGGILAYGSVPLAAAVYAVTLLAWVGALVLALRHRNATAVSDLGAFAAGASVIVAWVALLPQHTFSHSYMVRMLVAPMALGWAALFTFWSWRGTGGAPVRAGSEPARVAKE